MTKYAEWTSEQVFELRRLMRLSENPSYSDIAKQLRKKFNAMFTRNSVAGKAFRLHMPPRPPRPRIADSNKSPRRPRRPVDRPIEPIIKYRSSNGSPAVTELESGDCKWPSGTGPYTFCGLPVEEFGRPYCAHHAAIAYNKSRW